MLQGEQLQLAGMAGEEIERLAALVAAALAEHQAVSAKLLTVRQVAELLGVPCDFVYRHQRELGVIHLPTEGRRGRLRFDRDTLRQRLHERAAVPTPPVPGGRRPSRRGPVSDAELLPVRPRMAA